MSWEVGAAREVMTARLREIAIAETRYRRRRPDKLKCATALDPGNRAIARPIAPNGLGLLRILQTQWASGPALKISRNKPSCSYPGQLLMFFEESRLGATWSFRRLPAATVLSPA